MPETVNSPLSSNAYSINSVYVNGGFFGLMEGFSMKELHMMGCNTHVCVVVDDGVLLMTIFSATLRSSSMQVSFESRG